MNVGREVHGGSILNLHEKQKPPRELPHDGFRFSSHNMVGEMRVLYHYYGVEVNGGENKISSFRECRTRRLTLQTPERINNEQ